MNELDSKMSELQSLELEMLLKIVEICEKHQITYYLMGGTLLGAVRHQGFIPWDDDIDLGMPRPDYDKFLAVAENELKLPYKVISAYNDPKYQHNFARVINKNMKMLYKDSINVQKWSIWIDIFPLDSMPKNKIHFFFRKYYVLYRRGMVMLSCYEDIVNQEKKKRSVFVRMMMWVAKNFHTSKYMNTTKLIIKFDRALKRYPFEKGPYMFNAMGLYKFKTVFLREVYGKPTYLKFEGYDFRVPEQYDYFLKRIYGDYMELPPVEKRKHHNAEIIKE